MTLAARSVPSWLNCRRALGIGKRSQPAFKLPAAGWEDEANAILCEQQAFKEWWSNKFLWFQFNFKGWRGARRTGSEFLTPIRNFWARRVARALTSWGKSERGPLLPAAAQHQHQPCSVLASLDLLAFRGNCSKSNWWAHLLIARWRERDSESHFLPPKVRFSHYTAREVKIKCTVCY